MAIANRHGGRRPSRLKADRTVLSVFTYTYDNVGNRTAVAEASGDRVTWSYDNTYQLTREQRSGANAYDVTYSYDGVGNRLTKLEAGATTTFTCDAANQLTVEFTPSARTTYTYDANGNTTVINAAGSLTTNTWDLENRNTKIQMPGAVVNTFTYDGDGSRRRIEDSAGLRNLIWDTQNIVAELDSGNNTVAAYTLAPQGYGALISQRRSGVTSYHHYDALGSTDRLTDTSQAAVITYLYRGFGQQSVLTGSSSNPFTWLGRMGYYRQSDAGNYWVRARTYQPTIGRFLRRDPVLLEVNLYVYVGNRPLAVADPSGRERQATTSSDGLQLGCSWHSPPPGEPLNTGFWCCACSNDQTDIRRCVIHAGSDETISSGAPVERPNGMMIVDSFNVQCSRQFTEECSADFQTLRILPGIGSFHEGQVRTVKGKTGTIYPDFWGRNQCVVPCSTWNPYTGGAGSPPRPCAGTRDTSFTRRVCLDVAAFNQDAAAAQNDLRHADDIWGQCCIRVGYRKLRSFQTKSYYNVFHHFVDDGQATWDEFGRWEREARSRGVSRSGKSYSLAMYAQRIGRIPWDPTSNIDTLGLSDTVDRVVVSRQSRNSATLAHEIGHLFGFPDFYQGDSLNLMYGWAGNVPSTRLTLTECSAARFSSRLRRAFGYAPIITGKTHC